MLTFHRLLSDSELRRNCITYIKNRVADVKESLASDHQKRKDGEGTRAKPGTPAAFESHGEPNVA
jgi:hypothetical protein